MRNDTDFYAVRVIPGTKTTFDIDKKKGIERLHSYKALTQKWLEETQTPPHLRNSVAVLAARNRFVIIDVDAGGDAHKFDGRPFWAKFTEENSLPSTYTVMTRNGGYHFYFRLPDFLTVEDFQPPGELAPGVDIVYNGYVLAPPTSGYSCFGSIFDVADLPPTLLMAIENAKAGKSAIFSSTPSAQILEQLHTPFSEAQIAELRERLRFFQEHGKLSYHEWRDGLFSLKAGLPNNPEILEEFALAWTYNQSYQQGDESQALDIVEKATEFGGVGPGTIFGLLKNVAIREKAITVASPYSRFEIVQKAGVRFSSDKDGNLKVEPSESNASAITKVVYPEERLYFDVRKNSIVLDGQLVPDFKILNLITPVIQSEQGLGLSKMKQSSISKGLDILLTERSVDPHLRMIKSTEWDGIPRIDTFFNVYCGIPQTEYVRIVSKNFWISMAARGLKPGCKVDTMVVLEGGEGLRKSSLVRAIGGDYVHANGNPKLMIDEKELAKCHQAVIVELPELIGFIGQDGIVIKGFTAQSTDLIRPPYGKRAYDHPRGFVFFGTTNQKKYIPAGVGERRFAPLTIPHSSKIDTIGIKTYREQLFAEAAKRFNDGEDFWTMPKELLKPEIEKRKIIDPLQQAVLEYTEGAISGFNNCVRVMDVYTYLESRGFISKGLNSYIYQRIENILFSIGFEEVGGKWRKESLNELINSAMDLI